VTPSRTVPSAVRSGRRPILPALVLAVTALAACGGGDDGDGGDDDTSSSAPSVTADPGIGADPGPDATVSPDLPTELDGEVGPVEVDGSPLPPLGEAEVADDPALGTTAPVLVGQDFAGQTVRVDAAANGPTMVVFLAHWCPHCNAEVPRINELRDAGRFPEGLDIIAVSTALNPGRPNFPPSQWFEDMDWTYPVLVDGVDMVQQNFIAATAYGIDGFPFVALLDAEGKVAARWSGEHEPDEIIQLIEDNLEI
jgi:thiol-disulfide isomerase/thioredoxin